MNRVATMKPWRQKLIQQACTFCISLFIISFQVIPPLHVYATNPQKTQAHPLKKQIQKLNKQKKEIKELFRGVLKGTLRSSLDKKIQTFQNHLSDGKTYFKQEKHDKAHQQIMLARQKQRQLRQKLANAYLKQTTSMRKKIIRKYNKEILATDKARKMVKLAHQEESRGTSYLRIHHYPLTIHTLRRSRSFLFRALKLINRPIPDSFYIALADLKKLPKKHRPPQLNSESR